MVISFVLGLSALSIRFISVTKRSSYEILHPSFPRQTVILPDRETEREIASANAVLINNGKCLLFNLMANRFGKVLGFRLNCLSFHSEFRDVLNKAGESRRRAHPN